MENNTNIVHHNHDGIDLPGHWTLDTGHKYKATRARELLERPVES